MNKPSRKLPLKTQTLRTLDSTELQLGGARPKEMTAESLFLTMCQSCAGVSGC
jgi:hypothetical protein